MSKFDFFDEGVRRVFENYELPLEENAWTNFQSVAGIGASTDLLRSFVLPGLLVVGLFTVLHFSTPHEGGSQISYTTENNVTTGSSEYNDDRSGVNLNTIASQSRYSVQEEKQTKIDPEGIDLNSSPDKKEGMQENTVSGLKDLNDTKSSSNTLIRTVEKEKAKETFQEKLPENMASEAESGPTKTKFLGKVYKLGAPERFSPNNDDLEDTFMPPKLGKDSKFVLTIRDLKGDLVFVSNSVENTWDGSILNTNTPAETGDYQWKVILDLKTENKRKEYGGTVKLVR